MSDKRANARELLIVLGLVAVVSSVQIYFADPERRLLFRPLWLDECLTQMLANDPSFSHAMSALRSGVDTCPPTFYLLLRPLHWILGDLVTIDLRLFSAVMMGTAALGVYAICRRFFDRASSAIGLLCFWGHALVVDLTFEGRAYSAWLAATAWLCFFLVRYDSLLPTAAIIGACVAAIVCITVHWFGIGVVILIWLGDCLARATSPREVILRRSIPVICALLALLVCLPFLFGQRSGLTQKTWLEPVTLTQIHIVADKLFGAGPVIVALLVVWFWRVLDRDASPPATRDLINLAPVGFLLLFPVLVLLFSYVAQPSLLARYVAAAVLPLAILPAWLASQMTSNAARAVRGLLILALIIVGIDSLITRRKFTEIADARVFSALDETQRIMDRHGPLPMVYLRRHEAYPVVVLKPELTEAVATLGYDIPIDASLTRSTRYEYEMAQRVQKFYPQFRIANYSELVQRKHFFIIVPPEAIGDVQVLFPTARVRQHSIDLLEVTLP